MKPQIHTSIPSRLREYVSSIWEVYGERKVTETILPQGVIEIVYNLADGMVARRAISNRIIRPSQSFVQGLNTESLTVTYGGQHHLFGVRLKSHAIKKLLGISASELKDNVVDLSLLKRSLSDLWHLLAEAGSFADRVKIIEERFPSIALMDCSRTKKLSELLFSENIDDFPSVDGLAQKVYYSTRHLNRKAQSLFGFSAEELVSYKKYLHSTQLIHTHNISLIKVASRSGFYDQSHFNKTFKSFASMTPSEYSLKKGELPFHLFS